MVVNQSNEGDILSFTGLRWKRPPHIDSTNFSEDSRLTPACHRSAISSATVSVLQSPLVWAASFIHPDGNFVPCWDGRSRRFLDQENVVNLSSASDAELVSELLSPLHPAPKVARFRVCSPEMQHAVDALVSHRLEVAKELLLRKLRTRVGDGPFMSEPQAVCDWLRLRLADLEHEVFLVLYLDVQNRLIDHEEQFRGTLAETSVPAREVVKGALACNASRVVLVHNHPSGSAKASRADHFLTEVLRTALNIVEVRVLDHFLVAGDQIVSIMHNQTV
jgi:DNA repair protein RadC